MSLHQRIKNAGVSLDPLLQARSTHPSEDNVFAVVLDHIAEEESEERARLMNSEAGRVYEKCRHKPGEWITIRKKSANPAERLRRRLIEHFGLEARRWKGTNVKARYVPEEESK